MQSDMVFYRLAENAAQRSGMVVDQYRIDESMQNVSDGGDSVRSSQLKGRAKAGKSNLHITNFIAVQRLQVKPSSWQQRSDEGDDGVTRWIEVFRNAQAGTAGLIDSVHKNVRIG